MFQAAVQSMFVDWLFANVELVVPNSQQQQQQQLQLQVSENFSPAEKSGLVFEAPQFSVVVAALLAIAACLLVRCVCVCVCLFVLARLLLQLLMIIIIIMALENSSGVKEAERRSVSALISQERRVSCRRRRRHRRRRLAGPCASASASASVGVGVGVAFEAWRRLVRKSQSEHPSALLALGRRRAEPTRVKLGRSWSAR